VAEEEAAAGGDEHGADEISAFGPVRDGAQDDDDARAHRGLVAEQDETVLGGDHQCAEGEQRPDRGERREGEGSSQTAGPHERQCRDEPAKPPLRRAGIRDALWMRPPGGEGKDVVAGHGQASVWGSAGSAGSAGAAGSVERSPGSAISGRTGRSSTSRSWW